MRNWLSVGPPPHNNMVNCTQQQSCISCREAQLTQTSLLHSHWHLQLFSNTTILFFGSSFFVSSAAALPFFFFLRGLGLVSDPIVSTLRLAFLNDLDILLLLLLCLLAGTCWGLADFPGFLFGTLNTNRGSRWVAVGDITCTVGRVFSVDSNVSVFSSSDSVKKLASDRSASADKKSVPEEYML